MSSTGPAALLRRKPQVSVLNCFTVPGCRGRSAPGEVYAVSGSGRYEIRSRALVLATGALSAGPVPRVDTAGCDDNGGGPDVAPFLPGGPGNRVLVAGNGPLNLQVAAELGCRGGQGGGRSQAPPLPAPQCCPPGQDDGRGAALRPGRVSPTCGRWPAPGCPSCPGPPWSR